MDIAPLTFIYTQEIIERRPSFTMTLSQLKKAKKKDKRRYSNNNNLSGQTAQWYIEWKICVKPAECTKGRRNDSSQAEGPLLSVLTKEDRNAVLNLLHLLLAGCSSCALSFESLRLVHHTIVGVSCLVLQSQLHTGQELAGGCRRLGSKQHLIPVKEAGNKVQSAITNSLEYLCNNQTHKIILLMMKG